MASGNRVRHDKLQAKECQRWAPTARTWERQGKSSPEPSDRALSVRDVSIAWKHLVSGTLLPQPQETSTCILFKDMKVITTRTLKKGGRVGYASGKRDRGGREATQGPLFFIKCFPDYLAFCHTYALL